MTEETRAGHPSDATPDLGAAAMPQVRAWVIAGGWLVVAGYAASITSRILSHDFDWIATEFAALAGGLVGLVLAFRGRVRAAGIFVLAVVWLELHASIALADPLLGRFPGAPVFPLLVVATGLFAGGGAAIGVALASVVTVPVASLIAGHTYGVPGAVPWTTPQQVVVLDVAMVASALLVHLGTRSFRQALAARQAEAGKYALLVHHAPYGVVLLDEMGRVVSLNPAAEALLGVSDTEARNRTFAEVLGPAAPAADVLVMSGNRDAHVQTEIVLPHARERRLVEASGSRTLLSSGAAGVQIILRDVTGRREMERHAIQLGRMLDQALSEVYVFDAETLRLRYVNLGARRKLGYPAAELDALTITDVAPALTRSDVRHRLDDLSARPDESIALTGQHRRKDGTTYPIEGRLHLVSFAEDPAVGLFAIDVSERVATEQEQERLRLRMQQAQRFEVIQQLAGGIAHEFNNLLMSLGGYAEMIAEFAAEERVREWAGRIRVAQERGAALVRRIQGLARTDVVQPVPVALGAVLRDFLPVLERTLGPTVRVALETVGHDVVLMDRAQVEQVVLNLTTNAREAMPDGGTIQIVVRGPASASEPAGEVVLEVRDPGRGMSADAVRRAFEPFFTGKPRGGGTGLGLTTVRSIVVQAGGHVELESALGSGTVARVHVPVSAEQPRRRTTPAGAAVETAVGASGGILVVEDDADARAVVAHGLTRAGYQVRAVGSAEEGLAWLAERQGDVDLVLTDVALPGMTGFALGAEIRARFSPLRVLYMSGYAQEHIAGAPPEFDPVADLLVKPFPMEKLLATVRYSLDRQGRRISGPATRPDG
jgi:two-component system cell cycle sensor histidine kinase/response regulator CckA